MARLLEERERWFLWLPVGVGLGIALYFGLPREPPVWLGPALLVPLALASVGLSSGPRPPTSRPWPSRH